MKRNTSLAAALALVMATGAAYGELQQGRTDQGHPFVAGGVGDAEQQAIQQAARDYSLQLVLADQTGAYLADTDVSIADQQGNVVMAGRLDAPFLMVDLPPGRYTIEAQYEGRRVKHQVTVPASGSRRLVLRFNVS